MRQIEVGYTIEIEKEIAYWQQKLEDLWGKKLKMTKQIEMIDNTISFLKSLEKAMKPIEVNVIIKDETEKANLLMTDINKQIEEEARECYNETEGSLTCEEYFTKGAQFVLHSSRWRKVSEDEFPEIDTPIICKFRVGSMQPSIQYRVSTLLKSGRFSGETDWVSVVEWKYID